MTHKIRFVLLAAAILTLTGIASAQDQKNTEHSLDVTIGINNRQGWEPYGTFLQGIYRYENDKLLLSGGIQNAYGNLDITAIGSYCPLILDHIKLGGALRYNFDVYSDISLNHNAAAGLTFSTRGYNHLIFKAECGYLLKVQQIYAISQTTPALLYHSCYLSLRFDINLLAGLSMYLEGASYEMFRYMILGIPSFTLGFAYDTGNRVEFIIDATTRFIDFFTLSGTYDDTQIRFVTRIKW